MRFQASKDGRSRKRRGVISRRMRDNSLCSIVIRQTKNGIARAASFERKTILQVFTFEMQTAVKFLMQPPGLDRRRHQDMGTNSLSRLTNVIELNTELRWLRKRGTSQNETLLSFSI
jgi:hypothetical protein